MFFLILRNIIFSEMSFFSQKKAPAASRRAHKKVLSNINNTRTRQEQEEQEEKEKNLKREEKEKRRDKSTKS